MSRGRGAKGGDGERHRDAVVVVRVGDAAARRAGAVDGEAVRPLVGRDAEVAQAGHERGNAIAFLDAQLAGAADA